MKHLLKYLLFISSCLYANTYLQVVEIKEANPLIAQKIINFNDQLLDYIHSLNEDEVTIPTIQDSQLVRNKRYHQVLKNSKKDYLIKTTYRMIGDEVNLILNIINQNNERVATKIIPQIPLKYKKKLFQEIKNSITKKNYNSYYLKNQLYIPTAKAINIIGKLSHISIENNSFTTDNYNGNPKLIVSVGLSFQHNKVSHIQALLNFSNTFFLMTFSYLAQIYHHDVFNLKLGGNIGLGFLENNPLGPNGKDKNDGIVLSPTISFEFPVSTYGYLFIETQYLNVISFRQRHSAYTLSLGVSL